MRPSLRTAFDLALNDGAFTTVLNALKILKVEVD
jgi:hypothetical protein